MTKDTIGVDISKDRLDIYWLSREEARVLPNTTAGFAELGRWIEDEAGGDVLVVFEATGAYHRDLERHLGAAALPFVKVNPRQARRFAQAAGKLAKSDRVDARMLARMGVGLDLVPQAVDGEDIHDLRELLTARRALIRDQIAARARLATARNPLIREQLARRIADIDADIRALDAAVDRIAAEGTGDLEARIRRLTTIPGIGHVTATALLVDMPELGSLDARKIAALAGLAPMTQQSGRWQGKARIAGGRATIRRAIYMPALVAVRFNPDLRDAYARLLAAGKAKKVALTAIMRKLVILANTLMREERDWQPNRP